jgi:predicted transcriptional regulator of viral defense system
MRKGLSVSDYINNLQKKARYTFSLQDARAALDVSPAALSKSLQRLTRSKRLCQIRRTFYVIVPIEYSSGGILPADWFIDDFMKHIELPYYVGLLSAASLQGAGHQQPQEFQIVVPRHERPVSRGNLRLRFFHNSRMGKVLTAKVKTFTGYISVSTPESTALDLCRFSSHIGGLSVVLTVLTELAKKITPDALLTAAKNEAELSQVQRLGWLLEQTGNSTLVAPLADWLSNQQPHKVRLDVARPSKGFRKNPRWQIIMNAKPVSDL